MKRNTIIEETEYLGMAVCLIWAPQIGSIVTLGSTNLSFFSDSLSFSFILPTSLFMDLIFFLLNPALVLLDALVILCFKASIWDFKLSIFVSSLLSP